MPKNKDRKLIGSNYNYVMNNIRKYCELLFEFRMHRPNLTSGTDPGFPEGRQPIIRLSFSVNCMKMKEIGPRAGCTSKILLCRSPLYVEKPLHSGIAVADIRGAQGTRHPPGPNSFNFMHFFGKIWENCMLAPPLRGVGAPFSGKSWISHCIACVLKNANTLDISIFFVKPVVMICILLDTKSEIEVCRFVNVSFFRKLCMVF